MQNAASSVETWRSNATRVVGVAVALFHLYFNTLSTLPELWASALHFGLFGVLCVLAFPSAQPQAAPPKKIVLVFDILLGALALSSALYLILFEAALYERGVDFNLLDWIFAALAILLSLEFTRRTTGWIVPILIVASLTYVVWWGAWIPGVFGFPGLGVETVLYRSYFSTEGMFGSIARISWSFVFMFILFGAFLVKSGAGDVILKLAQAAAGRFRGGPGLIAVFGSGLMGSISGSAVANTASTGVITIPLMKRAHFSPRFAAGVEAAASTGGQLMPPVMGAGAFVMANFTQLSYLTIIAAAALPALLYFISVALFVRMEAIRIDIRSDESDAPSLNDIARDGWLSLVPLIFLVGALAAGFTPAYAVSLSIVVTVAVSWLSKTPMGLSDVIDAFALGARNAVATAVLLVAIGLMVNVVGTTGLGTTFSLMVPTWAQGSLLLTLLLVAVASLVLGMGLPVTASYIILATVAAPALFNLMTEAHLIEAVARGALTERACAMFALVSPELISCSGGSVPAADAAELIARVPPEMVATLKQDLLAPSLLAGTLLASHMIIFWLSQDSNVTPPVCLTAFAAASIAGAKPMETGFTSWRIAKGLYLVPILMAFTPLITGSWLDALPVFVFAVVGLYALFGSLYGVLERPVGLVLRAAAGLSAVLLLWPHGRLEVYLAGVFVLAATLAISRHLHRKSGPAVVSGS